MKFKWTTKALGSDLNESKLNARAENPDNLFEIIPKLLIDVEDGVEELNVGHERRIFAVTAGGTDDPIGIVLGSQILILNKERDKIERTINFSAAVDVVVWRRSVFIVGLCNSQIILLCPNTYEQKESRKVSDQAGSGDNYFFVDAYIHSNADPTKIDLLALGVNGAVYSFQNVSLVDGSSMDTTHEENMTLEIDVTTIKGTVLRYLPDSAHVLCAASPARDFVVSGEKNGNLTMFKLWKEPVQSTLSSIFDHHFYKEIDIVSFLELPEDVQIKKIVRCEGLLFVLFSNGRLEILLDEELHPTGPLILPKPNFVILDFSMVIYNTDTIKLWAIFADPEENEYFMGIFPAPAFPPEFIVRIPVPSESASSPEDAMDYSFPKQANPFDEPTAIIAVQPNGWTTVYHMSESSTDVSLENLLMKSRFEKAELLAKKYGKDLDLVWKAKARAAFNDMASGKTEKLREIAFKELTTTLQLVQDAEFVCTFCTSRERRIPKLEWVKEVLALGLKRVSDCNGSEAGRLLLLTWKKMYTFDQVLPGAGIEQWIQFNDECNTMFQQCSWFLNLIEFKKCEIVWLRHSDEFIPQIDLKEFASFFKVLFEKRVETPDAVSLFKTIFPFAVEKCESESELGGNQIKINAFVALIQSQIGFLEREVGFPNEALVFTKSLLTIIQEEHASLAEERDVTGEVKIEKKVNICASILGRLKKLIQALIELACLKKEHSVRIPFEKYISESDYEVVNSMFDLLFAKEEIERFVNGFLNPYATRNRLSMDTLFQNHIETASEYVQYYMNAVGIPFEERLVALVGFIQSPKIKLQCVLRMTEEWPVPWNPLMKNLVTKHLEMNTGGDEECRDLQKSIKLMETQVPYRCLWHKYRLTPSKLNTGFGVYMAVQRILTWNKPNAWEDCVELIKHTGKYSYETLCTDKFWLDLSSPSVELEDLIPDELKDRTDLKSRFLRRILRKFSTATTQSEESEEMWKRYTDAAKMLAHQTDDDKTIEFLKLRSLFPNLWKDDVVYSSQYPFSALEMLILPRVNSLTSEEIIVECDKLGVIAFANSNDFLVTVAAFLTGPANLGSALQKIWDLVKRIVDTPNGFSGKNGTITPGAGVQVAQHLILFAPTTSSESMVTLFEFCCLLQKSYEEVLEPIANLFGIIWIFQGLRDTEIPLEREFLNVYKMVWREGVKSSTELIAQLGSLGGVILRFGNTDLLRQIFNSVSRELSHQSSKLFGELKIVREESAAAVLTLKNTLLEEKDSYEVQESNLRVVNLVQALDDAGLTMNAYALRERNKEKLIEKLLEMNLFLLAAQTALVFDFRDQRSWSEILKEYMIKASIPELKTVLESLKKITDLWVLPEFSQAWLKVSEKYPSFKHMCPIPLVG